MSMSDAPVPPPVPPKLRSRAWFANDENIDMTSLYLERYLNFGLSLDELRSGKPIIGIAQTGSDLSPCNRHHLVLAERSEEHTSALQSLMRQSYAVFCLQKTTNNT